MVQQRAVRTSRRGIEIRRRLTTLFAATSLLPVLLLIYVSAVYVIPRTGDRLHLLLLLGACTLLSGAGFILILRTAQRLGEISRSLYPGVSSTPVAKGRDEMSELTSAAQSIKGKVDQQRQEIWQMKQQQAVLKLELQKAREEMQKNDDETVLPGTWDIEGWQDYLSQEVERSKRYHKRFCILYVNIIRFAEIIESLPDAERADISRLVTEKLRSLVRNSDLVAGSAAKYFGILMPETEPEGGRSVAARLVAQFPDEAFVSRDELQGLTFELCVGMATYPFDARDSVSLVDNAKSALAEAVKRGAGSFVIFDRHSMT